ncbi:MAG: hypothetical protein GY789_16135 [Hyphomicrobiales bacterium]|nr:hypothetical protein [Hyphomicrobiales bacterium]MCP5002104.1 hypothetical protein [Hyphomicrobiales bacterium]
MNLMKLCKVLVLSVTVALSWSTTHVSSFAQSNGDCLCLVPAGPDGEPVGSIISADGQVQVSQAVGFTPGAAGAQLQRGNRIIVGPRSNALIAVGETCRLRIPENNDVVLDPVDGNICVWSREASGQTAGQQPGELMMISTAMSSPIIIGGFIHIACSR